MQVDFKNTEEDIKALLLSYPFGKRIWLGIAPQCYVGLSILPSLILIAAFGMWLIAASMAAVIYGFLFLLIAWTIRAVIKMNYTVRIPPGIQTMRITDDYLEVVSDQGRSRRSWTRFHKLHKTDAHLVLFINSMRAYIIPISAFENRDQAIQFYQFAKKRVEHAQQHPDEVVDMRDVSADLIPNWATERPHQISYQPTNQQWARVEFYGAGDDGLKRLPSVRAAIGKVASMLFFGGMTISYIYYLSAIEEDSFSDFFSWVVAFFAILFISMPVFSFINWIRYTSFSKEVPEYLTEPVTSLIYSQGICNQSISIVSWGKWNMMDQITCDDELIAIHDFVPFVNTLIPRDCFKNSEQGEELLQTMLDFHATALELADTPEEDIVLAETVESGNPYQSPYTE